jgi:hypothetical protein
LALVYLAGVNFAQPSQRPSFQATVDYRRCSLTERPASCSRDDHLVRTLVAARCSALYFRTNLVSSVALGSHSVFLGPVSPPGLLSGLQRLLVIIRDTGLWLIKQYHSPLSLRPSAALLAPIGTH